MIRRKLVELIRAEILGAWSILDWEENIADAVLRNIGARPEVRGYTKRVGLRLPFWICRGCWHGAVIVGGVEPTRACAHTELAKAEGDYLRATRRHFPKAVQDAAIKTLATLQGVAS